MKKLRDLVDRSIMDVHARIDTLSLELNRRIDETNRGIDVLGAELIKRFDAPGVELNRRIDETNKRIDDVYAALGDVQKTMTAMQGTLLEILKVLAGIQRDAAELKRALKG